ncbi:hypothetical protein RCT95_21345 [Escherichia marmotae]|nr:hypothetical protein [Escherichia marmotae]
MVCKVTSQPVMLLNPHDKPARDNTSIFFQRCDEDMRERFQSASAGELLNSIKDKMVVAAF